MRKFFISMVAVSIASASLASCQSSPESTASLIKSYCSAAQDTSDAIQPWIDNGVIKGKDARNVEIVRTSLFGPTGLCVGEPTGTLAGALAKVTSLALTLTLVLRDIKKE